MTFAMVLCGLAVAFMAATFAQLSAVQHAALMTFYDALGCNATLCPRFMANEACKGSTNGGVGLNCSASSVLGVCDADHQRSCKGCRLTGSIPISVADLTALTQLIVNDNALVGTVPCQVGRLATLTALGLGNNRFVSSIPTEVGHLTNLVILWLDRNLLVGTAPTQIGRLTALTELSLWNNALGGALPTSFSLLTALKYFDVSNTWFTGVFQSSAPLGDACELTHTLLNCVNKPSRCGCSTRPEPANDICDNRRVIATGATNVSTAGATTCAQCGACSMQGDVFFEWRSTCTGVATVDICGLDPVDTVLGIFRGVCPRTNSTPTVAADGRCDDFGGCSGLNERAAFDVAIDETIVIRVGTQSSNATGASGSIVVSCLKSTTAAVTPVSTTAATGPPTSGPTMADTSTAPPSSSLAATTAASSLSPAATPAAPSSVGAVVGGVVGGAVALLAIVGLAVWLSRRGRASAGPRGADAEPPGGVSMRADAQGTIAESELERLEDVGKGAFGVVFKAKYNDELVAVKMVSGMGSEANIRGEVAVLKKLPAHANIASYRGVAVIKGKLALVLEYYAGGSLDKALEGASDADWPRVRQSKVASGIASGVAYLHKKKIVHRDLAARNVLLTGDSVARVTDFGLSIKSDAGKTSLLMGAAAWMAPEQLIKDDAGQYTFSFKSDVYSFGVVMYELFERKKPWSECKSHTEIAAKLEAGEKLPLDDDKYPDSVLSMVELCFGPANQRPDMTTVAGMLFKAHEKSQRPKEQATYIDDSEPHRAHKQYFNNQTEFSSNDDDADAADDDDDDDDEAD